MATDWRAAERAAPTSPQAEDALASSTAPFDLTSPTGPWVVFAPTGDTHVAHQLDALRDAGGIVRRLDARAMSTPETLFRTFARELAFPGYFGHNWNALADCLKDLHGDWHGNADVAIVIEHADLLWTRSYLPLFVAVLCDAAEQANLALDADGLPNGNPRTALHFVFDFETGDLRELRARLRHQDDLTVTRHAHHLTVSSEPDTVGPLQ